MRKFLIPAMAALALVAVTAVAVAQGGNTTVSSKVTVTPNKAGTKKKPQGIKLNFKATFTTPEDVERPIVTGGTVLIGKGGVYNGGKFAKCSEATLSRGGPSKCPSNSIMGKGSGVARADTVKTIPRITVVNGGGSKIYFYTVLQNPARVQAPVPATITKTSGKWAYKLTFKVPTSLQIVAGIPITLDSLDVTAGGKSYAKEWIATTSCPSNKKWEYQSSFDLSTGGSITFDGSTPCK